MSTIGRIVKADKSDFLKVSAVPTGLPQLDLITGIRGIPLRRITEITGPWSIGKTTLALGIIAQAQRMGMKTLFADVELTFNEEQARICGVDTSELDLLQAETAEDVLDLTEEWISKHRNAVVVLDSIGGLLPRAEKEKEAGGKTVGGQASLVAKFCRKIVPQLVMRDTALIVLNHEFVDIMSGQHMTSGGAKLAYHKSLWIKLKSKGTALKDGERRVGEVVVAQIRKNKMAATRYQECDIDMIYGKGFSAELDVLRDALDRGVITKSGSYFLFEGERIAFGQAKMRKALEEKPELLEKIKAKLA